MAECDSEMRPFFQEMIDETTQMAMTIGWDFRVNFNTNIQQVLELLQQLQEALQECGIIMTVVQH